MHKDIEFIKNEKNFINSERYTNLILNTTIEDPHVFEEKIKRLKNDFPEDIRSLIDLDTYVKDVKSIKIDSIENFQHFKLDFIKKTSYRATIQLSKDFSFETEGQREQAKEIAVQAYYSTLDRIYKRPEVKQALDIIKRRGLEEKIKKLESQLERNFPILNKMKDIFQEVINKEDQQAIHQACTKTMQAYQQDSDGLSALQVFTPLYYKKLKAIQNSGQMSKDVSQKSGADPLVNLGQKGHNESSSVTFLQIIENIGEDDIARTLEDFGKKVSEQKTKIQSELQSLKKEYELIKPLENEDSILDKARKYTQNVMDPILDRDVKFLIICHKLSSFYNFVEKNITHRVSDSLDKLAKKSHEALSLLKEEIKELEWLHSQKQSKSSDQPQVLMEQPSPANKQPADLNASSKYTDMTLERKPIAHLYLLGLFEKSHPQSFDDSAKIKTFLHEKNIKEAMQVATYIKQKDFFRHKLPNDAIKFAVHLSHEHGFLKDTDMTPERRDIVFSYLFGLFEKSHPQSFDDSAKIKTFLHEKNIREAMQVATYIERRHIHYKIRDDFIMFAIHLKHEHGFTLYQAGIDKNFNIVNFDRGSSSTFRLDIDRHGKILKDGRVQRVYLIGLQDLPQASSSDAQPKPMLLLAMQSTQTGYRKYGAGTPLPTGGVVDIVTAQHTTRKQPNLYEATLAIEMLQETHYQKEIKMDTLKFFDTTVTNNFDPKISLYDYDISTYTGEVKDTKPPENYMPSLASQETTGVCMVNPDKLSSAVKQELATSGLFPTPSVVKRSIKRQIAIQVLGNEDQVPRLASNWIDIGARRWSDFSNSTAMDDLAEYIRVTYREELGLASRK